MRRTVGMLVTAAVVVGCRGTSGAVLSDAEKTALTASVTARSAEWRAAAERVDAAAVLAFYIDGPETAVVNATDLLQREATLAWVAASLPSAMRALRSQTITATDQRFAVLDRDAIVETAIGEWTRTDTTTAKTSNHFAFTRVWVRRDGTWKILHSHLANVAIDPLVGTWELNLAKSAFSPGPAPRSETRIYEASGSDFKLTLNGTDGTGKPTSIQASYSMDGREHPVIGSPVADSQSIRRVDAFTAEGTLKKGGKVVQTVRREITKDGTTMTITFKGVNAGEQTIHNIMVFEKR